MKATYMYNVTTLSFGTLNQCVAIQMKAIEQFFHMVLFIMLYKVVPTFKSMDETLVCDHFDDQNGSY